MILEEVKPQEEAVVRLEYNVFEIRAEGPFSRMVCIVAARDGNDAVKVAAGSSLSLQSGKVTDANIFPEVMSSHRGVLGKYEWRKK